MEGLAAGPEDDGMTDTRASERPASRADVVLVGRMGSRVEQRELPSGDQVTIFTVVVDRPTRPRGAGASASTVLVDAIACRTFRVAEARRVAILEPGEWVRVEGSLRRRFWRAGGGLGSAMEVDVARVRRYRAATP